MTRHSWMIFACALGVGACAPRRTIVVIDAEESVRSSTVSLEAVVRTQPDGEARFRQVFEGEGLELPLVLELEEDRSARFSVEVRAYGAPGARGELVSSRLAAVRHGPPRAVELTLEGACREVRACRMDRLEGCVGGQCVPVTPQDW
ncbi:MAG: hypothetical protein ACK6CU_18445 [Deltaproteobacteria bacterium]|jgi:hypothetical protein